jgi:gluconate 2-dehydrogenase gamma chain
MAKDDLPAKNSFEPNGAGPDRRGLLKAIASAAPMLAVGTAAEAQPAPNAPASAPPPASGYQSLGPDEAAFTEAMVNVMCPADHLTPNGVDCGLAIFIDRQLASGMGKGDFWYASGPWISGKPQFGPQMPLTSEQFYKAGVAAAAAACKARFGKSFDQVPAADAEAFLEDLQKGAVKDARVDLGLWFNSLVYPFFVQGCFADPIYGGNADKVFWKMIGYPGLPAVYRRDMVAYRGKPHPASKAPKSILDFS